jgi:phage terminase small subunit
MNETKKTLRERKFIEAYINNGGNATEAFLAVNNKVNRNTAGVLGLRMLRKVKISIKDTLDQIGLTDVYLANKLKEGLEATKVIKVRYIKK